MNRYTDFLQNLRFAFGFLLLTLSALGIACTGTGRLAEGERLYAGAKVKINKAEKSWDTKILKTDLKKAVILPRPNKKILWMRPKLAIYNTFQNRRAKSVGNFISNSFGEPPVLYVPEIANRHRELLSERAANDGFFKTKIASSEKARKHTMKLLHEVQVRSPRELVDKVVYPIGSDVLTRRIASLQQKSLVLPGKYYHLEDLMIERQRLSDTLRNHGWYYFSPDNLLFEADTLHPPGDINLTLRVKNEVGQPERRQYRLAGITVYPDYDLAKQTDAEQKHTDTLRFDCIQYVYHEMATTPDILNRQIFLKCGEYYSNDDYKSTIYRLLNLNLYKFINIRFEVSPQADTLLHASIYLTPYRPERVEATFSGVFSPSFYYGLRAGAAYNHRNIFKGAEALRIGLDGAYLRTNKNNFDFVDFLVSDASSRLSIPRFLFIPERKTLAFSTTQFSLRHETNLFNYDLDELGKFRLTFQRLQTQAGYLWKKNRRGSVVQEVNPLNLGLQFSTISNADIRRQLIAEIPTDSTGTSLSLLTFVEFKPNYTFTLDQRLEPARRHSKYFRQRFAFQASGYTGSKYLPADYVLNSPLNLFIESDYRQYQKTHGRNVLALRMAVGAGIPLRSNGTIALLDRFVIGGASSVRAFAPRTVGPGGQARDTSTGRITVGNYTGNMLIESSLEYRMPIGRFPELAFFIDAGNIWLTSGPDASEATYFRINRFYRELAVGTGAGLRVNLGFFVMRLDVAFPLSKPYLPTGERWVANNVRFGSSTWRRDNLNWNFSFGYPF
ncbi:MAG: BamA/TamA family outer membrane protein [Lewinellaceae bacterium]|nr:BamA/TamA family outer membrane protein [Lewinellaceae bacterium]